MAERLTTNQEVPGSTPGWIGIFLNFCSASTISVLGRALSSVSSAARRHLLSVQFVGKREKLGYRQMTVTTGNKRKKKNNQQKTLSETLT